MYTKFWLENMEGRNHFEGLSVNGRTLLEWAPSE